MGCKQGEPDGPAPTAEPAPATQVAPPGSEPKKPSTERFHDVHTHLNALGAAVTLEVLEPHGLARVVNLSGGFPGRPGYEDSLAVLEVTKGRVVPFFNVDWSRLESEGDDFGHAIARDLEVAVAAGFGGLKISKALGLGVERADGSLMPVDDPLLDPIFDKAGALGVPVAIHTGDPKAFFEPPTPQNERWAELSAHPSWSFHGDAFPSRTELLEARNRRFARHPKTTFIAVHFGNNPEDPDDVERVLEAHPNVVLDISARLGEIGRHDKERMRAFFIEHAERILFGTDFMLFAKRVESDEDDEGGVRISMILGSSGSDDEPPPTIDDAHRFFDAHWRFLESDAASMPNPVPIQGEWDIHPLELPADVLEKIYLGNAERLVFGPWDARQASPPSSPRGEGE